LFEEAVPFVRFRIVEIPRWKLALGAVLFCTLLFALFILAAGIFLLVLPVAVVAGALAYLFGRRTRREDFPQGFPDDVIEAEYREVETNKLEQDKK
jgi:hypothetical protein